MSDQTLEIPNRSRSVFDAILAWHDILRGESRSPRGFVQYTHALEGMLQDPSCSKYADHLISHLWGWLSLAKDLDSNNDAAEVFLSYLHTAILWLVYTVTRQRTSTLPNRIPDDYGKLDFKYLDSQSRRQRAITSLGPERVAEIIRQFRNDPNVVRPTSEEIDALLMVFVLELRENMADAIVNSDFGTLLLASESPSHRTSVPTGTPVSPDRIPLHGQKRLQLIADAMCEMTIRIRFLDSNVSPSRAGQTLWCIGAAMESIEGVAVEIDDWGKGSLWSNIKVFIKNVWSRDEVREVLDKGRQAAVSHYLDRPTEEVRKLTAECDKLEEEKATLEQRRLTEPDADQKYRLIELQIREKEQDVRAKELENRLKEIRVIKYASKLVCDGLLAADKVQIDIDGVCTFLFDGTQVVTRPVLLEEGSADDHIRE